jgi:hypothetical protein
VIVHSKAFLRSQAKVAIFCDQGMPGFGQIVNQQPKKLGGLFDWLFWN